MKAPLAMLSSKHAFLILLAVISLAGGNVGSLGPDQDLGPDEVGAATQVLTWGRLANPCSATLRTAGRRTPVLQ